LKFTETVIDSLDTKTPEGLMQLLSKLCGQDLELSCCYAGAGGRCERCPECMNYGLLTTLSSSRKWNLSRFNQVLLLLNQPTVSEDFFSLFFGAGGIDKVLKQGVINFRGFAMLRFGNFRFAYKRLAPMNIEDLARELKPYMTKPKELKRRYTSRLAIEKGLIQDIDRKKRWYLGYISGTKLLRDLASLLAAGCQLGQVSQAEIEESLDKEKELDQQKKEQKKKLFRTRLKELATRDLSNWKSSVKDLEAKLRSMQEDVSQVQKIGWANTVAYLTSDYLDVYVATSMRESWEYESTVKFVQSVFADADVAALRLGYFDPTLSFLKNRIDKGLVEGLMLKRANCTLYMIQETDTLGKDSELASTLAQRKPVIAYVPKMTPDEIKNDLKSSPLRFTRKRLMLLMAEDRLSGDELKVAAEFIRKTASFDPVFSLVGNEEATFIQENHADLEKVWAILASAESAYFDKRATDLMRNHPLAMQVHLESGVANGVLVVRSPKQCAELLCKLLTNNSEFTIEYDEGCTILREKISTSPYRVVTDDATLTNSFWNFYL